MKKKLLKEFLCRGYSTVNNQLGKLMRFYNIFSNQAKKTAYLTN